MKIIIALMILVSAAAYGDQFFRISSCEVCYHETFDCFEGSYQSLTNGFAVYKDYRAVMTNGDLDFRGVSDGGITAGGCYSLQTSTSNRAIGFQPTDTKFTPGMIELCVTNVSNFDIRMLSVSYDLVYLNNSDRASSVKLTYSGDNKLYETASNAADGAVTPLMKDESPVWSSSNIVVSIQPKVRLVRGAAIFLRWVFDDAGGAGARDEYGIDNVKITASPVQGTVIYIY